MRKVVLYRRTSSLKEDDDEIEALQQAGFQYLMYRTQIQSNDLVVPRYSAVPFYNELAAEADWVGAKLINANWQYNYIADLQNYVLDLKELTPLTWKNVADLPEIGGPYIIKGGTNSRKSQWKTHMFAENKKQAIDIVFKLMDDSLIKHQNIYIREYVPLYTYMEGIGGIPITKEFRFFVYNQKVLTGAYYWSSHIDDLTEVPNVNEVPLEFLEEVMRRVASNYLAPIGYVIDVGIKVDGSPIVIELNDISHSGLSENDPKVFYKELFKALT